MRGRHGEARFSEVEARFNEVEAFSNEVEACFNEVEARFLSHVSMTWRQRGQVFEAAFHGLCRGMQLRPLFNFLRVRKFKSLLSS